MNKVIMKVIVSLLLINKTIVSYQSDLIGDLDGIYTTLSDSITRADCSFSLQQVTQFNIPFTITNPGLYCIAPNIAISPNLTGLVAVSSGIGITISTNNVIIEGNDTVLAGQGGSIGIFISPGVQNIIIRNLTINSMKTAGININNGVNQISGPIFIDNVTLLNNANGIIASNPFNVIARNTRSYFSTTNGFFITQATNCFFKSCISNNNRTQGFSITNSNSLVFAQCQASANTTNGFNINGLAGSQFIECTANNNQNGFFQSNGTIINQNDSFDGCFATQNSNSGFFLVANQINLENCTSVRNSTGFQITGNNNSILNAVSKSNNNNGFQLIGNCSQLQNCEAISNGSNGFQINGNNNSILLAMAKKNSVNGIQLTGTANEIQDCHSFNNGSNGIVINGTNNSILNSVAKQNTVGTGAPTNFGNGILLSMANGFGPVATYCEIRGNTLTGNTTGINNQGTTNQIYANFANNNTTNFAGVPNVAVSPTILTPINFTANISE